MSDFTFQHRIDGPEDTAADAPLEVLVEFFQANGYSLPAGAESELSELEPPLLLTRGESGAGWWSSNMTELHAIVEIRRQQGGIVLDYQVDLSGQHFTDADRSYWHREAEAAERHLAHPNRQPRNLRPAEADRAAKFHGSMLTYGIWGAVLIFVVITFLRFLGML